MIAAAVFPEFVARCTAAAVPGLAEGRARKPQPEAQRRDRVRTRAQRCPMPEMAGLCVDKRRAGEQINHRQTSARPQAPTTAGTRQAVRHGAFRRRQPALTRHEYTGPMAGT